MIDKEGGMRKVEGGGGKGGRWDMEIRMLNLGQKSA